MLASYNVWMKAVACLTTLDRQKTGKDSNVNYKSDSDRFAADNFTQDDEFSYRGIQVLCNGYNVEEDEKKRKRKRHSSGSIYFFFIKNFL